MTSNQQPGREKEIFENALQIRPLKNARATSKALARSTVERVKGIDPRVLSTVDMRSKTH